MHAAASSGGERKWTSSLLGDCIDLHPEGGDSGSVDVIGVNHELGELALGVGGRELKEKLASIDQIDVLDGISDDFRYSFHGFGVLGIGWLNGEGRVVGDDLLSVRHFFFVGATSKVITGDLNDGWLFLDLSHFFGLPGRHLVRGGLRFGFGCGSWRGFPFFLTLLSIMS